MTSSNPLMLFVLGYLFKISSTTLRPRFVQSNLPGKTYWNIFTNGKTEERLNQNYNFLTYVILYQNQIILTISHRHNEKSFKNLFYYEKIYK